MKPLHNRPCPNKIRVSRPYLLLPLFLFFYCNFSVYAQCSGVCDYTESSLISGALSTIPAGKVVCITTNTCLGAASIPGNCSNTAASGSLTINGILRICPGVTFSYYGTITGTGQIEILSYGRMNMNGTYDCSVKISAVDPSLTTPGATSTSTRIGSTASGCLYPNCESTFSDGYAPFGAAGPGMGITAYNGSCFIEGEASNDQVMALQLMDWEVAWKGTDVLLSWMLQGNDPAAWYEVDYSRDAVSWSALSKILGGANVITYSYLATGPFSSRNFFRIKRTDAAGLVSYSAIKELDLGVTGDNRIIIGPNPVSSFLYLQPDGVHINSSVELFDMTGKSVLRVKSSPDGHYDLQGIAPGSYALVIIRNDETRVVKKITKL